MGTQEAFCTAVPQSTWLIQGPPAGTLFLTDKDRKLTRGKQEKVQWEHLDSGSACAMRCPVGMGGEVCEKSSLMGCFRGRFNSAPAPGTSDFRWRVKKVEGPRRV